MLSAVISSLLLFQTPNFEVGKYMATFENNGFVIITNDSVFRWKKGIWQKNKLIKNEKNLDDLLALNLDQKVYLISRGVGLVYELNKDSLTRIDRSFNWRSRYNTNFFFKDQKIYSLGGYGLWTSKNNLVYFDYTTSEWILEEYKQIEKIPFDFSGGTIEIKDSVLYFMGPPIKNIDQEEDVFSYNFNSREWRSLGVRKSEINRFKSNFRTEMDYPIVYDKNGNVGKFIYSKNEFRHYKSPKTGILKDSRLIIGNPNSKEFMVFIENGTNKEIPVIVSESMLLGSEYEIEQIFSPRITSFEVTFIVIVLIFSSFLLFFIIKKRKLKLIDQIKSHWNEIEVALSNEELKILKLFIDKYPDTLELPYILDRFSPNLTYESKIKKFRKSILNIETKIKEITKYRKGAIILSRKNKEDKRIKELYLND